MVEALQDDERKILSHILNYAIKQQSLFALALTHRSLSPSAAIGVESYERLEFLGDRVLGLVIAEMLYEYYPEESEGDLSRRLTGLVSQDYLAFIAQKLRLHDLMRISAGEASLGGKDNPSLQSDLVESLIGALWLDDQEHQGKAAFDFIKHHWRAGLENPPVPPKDPKSGLQEWCMSQHLGLPEYKLLGQTGPDHAPVFSVQLEITGQPPLIEQGKTIRLAQKALATTMLQKLNLL
ncbi:MAG: ribonuclease III [Alphaproteobacteria bacterium]